MTGRSIALLVPILFMPLLTRLYEPEMFGAAITFVTVGIVISYLLGGCYDVAVMLPKTSRQSLEVMILALGLSGLTGLALSLTLFLTKPFWGNIIHDNYLQPWIPFIPVLSWFYIMFQGMSQYTSAKQKYIRLASANILQQISYLALALCLSFTRLNGILIGRLLGHIASGLILIFYHWKNFSHVLFTTTRKRLFVLARRYREFPAYNIMFSTTGALGRDALIIALAALNNLQVAGFIALARTLLTAPSIILNSSLGQVFYEEAKHHKTSPSQDLENIIIKIMDALALVCTPLTILIVLKGEFLFSFVFGEQWADAGRYASILIIPFYIYLYISWLGRSFVIMEKQKFLMFLQLVFDGTSILSVFILLILYPENVMIAVISWASLQSIFYMVFLTSVFKIMGFSLQKLLKPLMIAIFVGSLTAIPAIVTPHVIILIAITVVLTLAGSALAFHKLFRQNKLI